MNARKEAVNAKVRMRLQTQKDLTSFLISSTMFFVTATFVWVDVFIDLLKDIEDIAFFDQFDAEVITQCFYHHGHIMLLFSYEEDVKQTIIMIWARFLESWLTLYQN